MLSKLIKQKIEERFGQAVRYPKDCDRLASHISEVCRATLSASTLRRLMGFVSGMNEPRLYTLDVIAAYLGYKGWAELLDSFVHEYCEPEPVIETLGAEQVKNGQVISLAYEPGKHVELEKVGVVFKVLATNDKKIQSNDVVDFRIVKRHYPLTFTTVTRDGKSIGRVQVATVSGITAIRKS